MAITGTATAGATTSLGANALGIVFDRSVIHSLQPNLYYEQIADIVMVEAGNNTSRFAVFNQIANASVTTLSEAANPTGVAVSVTVSDMTPTQYGISVQMSDLVVLTAFIDLIQSSAVEVGYAVARKIDSVIQTTAHAGSNVYYAGNVGARASLGAGNVIDVGMVLKGVQKLVKGAAPTFEDGMYRMIADPDTIFDLKSNTSVGQWVDISKYAQPDKILNGEIGALHGTRIMQSPNIDTFSSTVTVHPALIAGKGGFKVAYWLPGKVKNYILPPEDASIANPLGQTGSVGAKVNMGAARVQEARLVRLEQAVSTSL